MTISTLDQLVAALPGQHAHLYKTSQTAEGAGTWHSLWKAGGRPGAGASPPAFSAGSGYVPTSATVGAIPFTNPVSGYSYLARMFAASSVVGTLIVYDRLWACSGFATNIITTQNVSTPGALTRPDANGGDVELWGEVYSAPGATAATWTVAYTDQDNNGGQSATYAHPANAESVGQMFPFVMAAGDTGIRSVASLTCSISSGTAGDVGLTLLRRVAEIPLTLANVGAADDGFKLGLPRIYDSACLAQMVMCSTTSTGEILAGIDIAQG